MTIYSTCFLSNIFFAVFRFITTKISMSYLPIIFVKSSLKNNVRSYGHIACISLGRPNCNSLSIKLHFFLRNGQ